MSRIGGCRRNRCGAGRSCTLTNPEAREEEHSRKKGKLRECDRRGRNHILSWTRTTKNVEEGSGRGNESDLEEQQKETLFTHVVSLH